MTRHTLSIIRFSWFILAFTCLCTAVSAQLDQDGNPVFKSKTISKERLKYYQLTSNYYTIADNISNIGSPYYISDAPTTADYIRFAREAPAYFFVFQKSGRVLYHVTLIAASEKQDAFTYNIVEPYSGKSLAVPCSIEGEIADKRVRELKQLQVIGQPAVTEVPANETVLLNGVYYKIQPYDKVKAELMRTVNYILAANRALPQKKYIREETIGGDLDFGRILAEQPQFLYTANGVVYKEQDFAAYLWGQKVKALGVKSSKKAVKRWEKLHWRKLTDTEKKALIAGFEGR